MLLLSRYSLQKNQPFRKCLQIKWGGILWEHRHSCLFRRVMQLQRLSQVLFQYLQLHRTAPARQGRSTIDHRLCMSASCGTRCAFSCASRYCNANIRPFFTAHCCCEVHLIASLLPLLWASGSPICESCSSLST